MFEAYIANGWRNKSAASETSTVIFQWTDADRNSLFRRNTKTWTVADACKPLTSTCKIRSFCTVFWYFYACVPHPMDIFTHSSYILLWHFIWFLLLLLLHFFFGCSPRILYIRCFIFICFVIWRACCTIFNCAFQHSSMIHFFWSIVGFGFVFLPAETVSWGYENLNAMLWCKNEIQIKRKWE